MSEELGLMKVIKRISHVLHVALLVSLTAYTPAYAGFRICNGTEHEVSTALGYYTQSGWVSEGWWNLKAKECNTILTEDLTSRYYYLYALDYFTGESWGGNHVMCTRDKSFKIYGIHNCFNRGYNIKAFDEIDTKEQLSWTVELKQ